MLGGLIGDGMCGVPPGGIRDIRTLLGSFFPGGSRNSQNNRWRVLDHQHMQDKIWTKGNDAMLLRELKGNETSRGSERPGRGSEIWCT